MVVAVVDMGTNSTRLLVADVDDGARRRARAPLDRSPGWAAASTPPASSPPRRSRTSARTVGDYIAVYEELGAERGRSRSRPAPCATPRTASAFIAELRERFALDARMLDGDRGGAARPTWAPPPSGPPPTPPWSSTSAAARPSWSSAAGDEVGFYASLQAGAVRHTERHLKTDPPDAGELEALAADVAVADRRRARAARRSPRRRTGSRVAGTPTSLAAIELELDPYDPERVHGHLLSLERDPAHVLASSPR